MANSYSPTAGPGSQPSYNPYAGFQPGTFNYNSGPTGLLNQPYGTNGWANTAYTGNSEAGYGNPGQGPNFNYSAINMGTGPQGAYAYGLPTNFNSPWNIGPGGTYNNYESATDPDVRGAQQATNYLAQAAAGVNPGVSSPEQQGLLDMYLSRIGEKNSLGSSIAGNTNMENSALKSVEENANAAADSGIRNTRNNFNSRGLLYSGLREAGEQGVRGAVAAEESGDIAGTRQDYGNLKSSEEQAYSAVDLANQQQTLQMAQQTFQTVAQNNIARAQAYQQLGAGVGAVGGVVAGGLIKPNPSTTNPTATTPAYAGTDSYNPYYDSFGSPNGSFSGGGSLNQYGETGGFTGGGTF